MNFGKQCNAGSFSVNVNLELQTAQVIQLQKTERESGFGHYSILSTFIYKKEFCFVLFI
ncbi:hypothetical protein LINPERHAP1_LOCUS9789 [Linum perenne]